MLRRYANSAYRELSFDPADVLFLQRISLPEEGKVLDRAQQGKAQEALVMLEEKTAGLSLNSSGVGMLHWLMFIGGLWAGEGVVGGN